MSQRSGRKENIEGVGGRRKGKECNYIVIINKILEKHIV